MVGYSWQRFQFASIGGKPVTITTCTMFDRHLEDRMQTVPAAQYLRVSTERQEYSLQAQSAGIAAYAAEHGFVVCQTYCDEAKSGLDLARRPGLSQLLRDVVAAEQTFRAVLVYDVSRWGRFQNPDEAAHYEFLCKAAGVQIHYCAEQFSSRADALGSIMKAVKRVMAGEYSRELGQKVKAGLIRLVGRGFRTGGEPGYGFRRMLVSPDGDWKQQLSPGERKSIATDRVILVLGPPEELFWVREIYRLFTEEGNSFAAIASELNHAQVPFLPSKRWSDYVVKRILTHPKYKGTLVYNRTTEKLGSKSRRLPESQWIVLGNAIEPIVSPLVFEAAQDKLRQKSWYRSNEEILNKMKSILRTEGCLSQVVLTRHGLPGNLIAYRFGSMIKGYELAGYESPHRKNGERRSQIRIIRDELIRRLVEMFPEEISVLFGTRRHRRWIKVRNGPEVAVRICRSVHFPRKGRVWAIQNATKEHCPLTLMGGMDPQNRFLEVVYVAGRLQNRSKIHITEKDDWLQNGTRLEDLRTFCDVVRSHR